LREKGKNLATHEDIQKLIAQIQKTTEATEQIKAQISGGLWEQQNRWTFKRDLYIRLLENLGITYHCTTRLLEIQGYDAAERQRLQTWADDLDRQQSDAVAEVLRASAVAMIVVDAIARAALIQFEDQITKARQEPTFLSFLHSQRSAVQATYDHSASLLVMISSWKGSRDDEEREVRPGSRRCAPARASLSRDG